MDYVLIDGDEANFEEAFGPATVVVQRGRLRASGPATVGGKKVCIDGDESSVSVPGCTYTTPQYSIPGTGTLAIAALGGDQTASKTRTGGTIVMLVGSTFAARFTVSSPAQQPPPSPGPPIPDACTQYSGSGTFRTFNTKARGT